MTAACEANDQTIVAFDSLAWRYDDLFSRSRIGTQRGAVWEVPAEYPSTRRRNPGAQLQN